MKGFNTIVAVVLLGLSCWAQAKAELSPVDQRLAEVGARVETFWREVASISCTETVEQLKIDPEKNKTLNERHASYDYLVFLQLVGGELAVEESRVLQEESKAKKIRRPSHRPLLLTNGFSLMLLIFHPHFQSSYVFEEAPDELWNGVAYRKLRFEHVRGAGSPSALQLKERIYPIEWRGEVWIDPASGQVARMQAELAAPMADIGLREIRADVEYRPFESVGGAEAAWMPSVARVSAATERQLWRNEHRFADYRRFAVETDFKIGDPNLK